MTPTTNTGKHAELELAALKKLDRGRLCQGMENEIVALADAFGKSGQSIQSATPTARMISDLLYKVFIQTPIVPLTGEDDEWEEIKESKEKISQNKRCGSLFKPFGDKAKYIEAIVFVSDNGLVFSGQVEDIFSYQNVKSFPFVPKTFYIDVVTENVNIFLPNDKNVYEREDGSRYRYKIKDWDQLVPVFEYYEQLKAAK